MSFEIFPRDPYGGIGITGTSTHSWADKSIEECVEKVAGYGYTGIDFFYDKFLELSEKELAEVKEHLPNLVAEKGLEIPSVGAHHLKISPRTWVVKQGIETVKDAIKLASSINAKTVVSYVDGYYNPPTYIHIPRKKAEDMFISMIRECADCAQKHDIDFSVEPHQDSIINTPEATLELLERVNRDNVYITIDFGGIEVGMRPHTGSPEEAIKMFGKRINHVHAKDIVGVPGNWNMCWFGGGQVNFRRYAKALKEIGYGKYISVEWEGWFRGGLVGVGDMREKGMADMDRVAQETKDFLEKYF